jgi:hypothetical protein
MIDGVVLVMLFTCLISMWGIRFRINDEIANLRNQQFESVIPSDPQDAVEKQWATLYDELTHSTNTALFAFIRYDHQTKELIECDIQNIVWYIIMIAPLMFVSFWVYSFIKQPVSESLIRGGSGIIWWLIRGFVAVALFLWTWWTMMHNVYTAITKSVLDIAMLANGLSYGQ